MAWAGRSVRVVKYEGAVGERARPCVDEDAAAELELELEGERSERRTKKQKQKQKEAGMRLERKTTQEGNQPRFPLRHRAAAGARPIPPTYSSLYSLHILFLYAILITLSSSPSDSVSGRQWQSRGVWSSPEAGVGAGFQPRPATHDPRPVLPRSVTSALGTWRRRKTAAQRTR